MGVSRLLTWRAISRAKLEMKEARAEERRALEELRAKKKEEDDLKALEAELAGL